MEIGGNTQQTTNDRQQLRDGFEEKHASHEDRSLACFSLSFSELSFVGLYVTFLLGLFDLFGLFVLCSF